MSNMKKISGQATGLGVATLVAVASWYSPSFAQDPAHADKAAAHADKAAAHADKAAAHAHAKKDPAGPGKPQEEKLKKMGKEPMAPGSNNPMGHGTSPAKAEKVSRQDAILHYRSAQKTLVDIVEPADPKSEAAAEARKNRRDGMRELRRARDEILRAHNDERREFQKRNPDEVEKMRKDVAQHTAGMRKDRKERAEKQRAELAKVVGTKTLHPAVREELRSHAWRLARLNQLIYLAELDKKPAFAEKAKTLIEKETTGYEARMKALLAKPEVKNYKPPAAPPAPKLKPGSAAGPMPPNHPTIPMHPPTTQTSKAAGSSNPAGAPKAAGAAQ